MKMKQITPYYPPRRCLSCNRRKENTPGHQSQVQPYQHSENIYNKN